MCLSRPYIKEGGVHLQIRCRSLVPFRLEQDLSPFISFSMSKLDLNILSMGEAIDITFLELSSNISLEIQIFDNLNFSEGIHVRFGSHKDKVVNEFISNSYQNGD